MCGLAAPDALEGTSLAPVLADPTAVVKDAAITQHPRPAYPPGRSDPDAMGYSLRTERFRYTEWRDFSTGSVEAVELYDHEVDPGEMTNLARQKKYSANVQRLSRMLDDVVKPVPRHD